MDDKEILYGVGIALTFALGVWNLVVNLRSVRKTSFINTVTSERVKWLEILRQDISTFAGLTYTWSHSGLAETPEEPDLLKQVDKLRHLIRLRLNPEGNYDRRLEQLLAEIPSFSDPLKQKELQGALEEFTVTTQNLLKQEWEKVKQEAEFGNLKRIGPVGGRMELRTKWAVAWFFFLLAALVLFN